MMESMHERSDCSSPSFFNSERSRSHSMSSNTMCSCDVKGFALMNPLFNSFTFLSVLFMTGLAKSRTTRRPDVSSSTKLKR